MKVKDLPEDAAFVSDYQDTSALRGALGIDSYDSYFFTTQDGEYTAVWGMEGIVPYLNKPVEKLL